MNSNQEFLHTFDPSSEEKTSHMLNSLQKRVKSPEVPYRFSVIIPSWNNLEYLQLCIEGLRQNSAFQHQIIVHVNEGKDGTIAWLDSQADIDYTWSKENIGVCYGLNIGRTLVKADYICYLNDDMYVLPEWDRWLYEDIEKIGHPMFILSATAIEPRDTGNACVIVRDYGEGPENFDRERLLREYDSLLKEDWLGSTWPPIVLHRDLWDLVGGLSIEFSPGMYSDPDLSRKLWKAGVRYFKGLGKSRAYHFGSKSTKRRRMNRGKDEFLLKWGISSSIFSTRYLQRGKPFHGVLETPTLSPLLRLKMLLKRIISAVRQRQV